MNKHLIDTRLRSIAHYNAEEKRLQEALKVTQDTRRDIINSLSEMCEWKPGEILFNGERIMKFKQITGVNFYSDMDIRIGFEYFPQAQKYGWGGYTNDQICIDDIKKWKVIKAIENTEPA